ncbi:MAG: hypothetical protein NTU53_20915 [Planctomycetota bacterium]|nr:hypothetical protein [Planctomycetota bacterium]
MRKVLFFSVMVTVCAWVVPVMGGVGVVPKGSALGGKTTTQWTADWEIWQYSFPGDVPNPYGEGATLDASVNQPAAPVFFLGGTAGGPAVRSFAAPAGKYMMVPLLTCEWSQQETPGATVEELRKICKDLLDRTDMLKLSVNGVDVLNLFDYREITDVPAFTFVDKNVGGVTPGPSGAAVSDGFFVLAGPFEPGTYALEFGGRTYLDDAKTQAFEVSIKDTIQVVPEPGALGLAGLAVLLGRRRR